MQKSKGRLWNAVKSLRGKRVKWSDGSQDDSESTLARAEEVESESELERHVKRWLSESCAPQVLRVDNHRDRYSRMDHSTVDFDKPDAVILYHPDFIDWTSINTQESMTSQPTKAGPDDLRQVWDGAAASLSKLLSAPFG
jgi:hypothetical protein